MAHYPRPILADCVPVSLAVLVELRKPDFIDGKARAVTLPSGAVLVVQMVDRGGCFLVGTLTPKFWAYVTKPGARDAVAWAATVADCAAEFARLYPAL